MYAEVILPLSLPNLFTYAIPDTLQSQCCEGKRVVVPFGKNKLYSAIVYKITEVCSNDYEIKEIVEIIDEKPIVSAIQLRFWSWIASYYMCYIGEVYRAAVPTGLKLESETILFRTPKQLDYNELSPKDVMLLAKMDNGLSEVAMSQIQKITGLKNNISLVKKLIASGYLVADNVIEEKIKPKTEKYLILSEIIKDELDIKKIFDELEKKAPKQLMILMFYISNSGIKIKDGEILERGEISKKKILENQQFSQSALTSLVTKGIFYEKEREVSRLEKFSGDLELFHNLTTAQQNAFDDILKLFEHKNTVLLYGVTGSGKTEIYIKLIDQYLQRSSQVLYILPEIVLTSQIIRRLQKVFGDAVCIYHSKISDAERTEIWQNLSRGDENSYKLILGVRSSIFLPFTNLGLIIVDEEHETSFKQFDPAPRYNARDCAVVLATFFGAKVLLGSATPAVESYYNAVNGKYGLVELTKRYSENGMPEIFLVDTFAAAQKKQMKSLFSPQLLAEIRGNIKRGEQSVLFRNRRGFSPYVECESCGWIPMCQNCDVSLTYHKRDNRLVCHHCGFIMDMPQKCCACGDNTLKTIGFGTEKIEDEIKIFFPDANIARLDSDTTTSKSRFEKIISDFENGEIDILAGTQMISKGFDFKKLKFAGILSADSMLNFPDFRAEERAFQLITQVAGRTGRTDMRGRVLVQTSHPEKQVFEDIITNNYKSLYSRLIAERSKFAYPPFSKLIKIQVKHKEEQVLNHSANILAVFLRKIFGVGVLGPEFPLISRIQTFYLKDILIKISKNHYGDTAKQKIWEGINYTKSTALKPGLIITINVDPL